MQRDPHAERPNLPLPGPNWSSVDEARAWLIAEEKRLAWTHRQFERAYYIVTGMSEYGRWGSQPVVNKAKLDRFRDKGRGSIPPWLYWLPLAIQRVEQIGWNDGLLRTADNRAWDEARIPQYFCRDDIV